MINEVRALLENEFGETLAMGKQKTLGKAAIMLLQQIALKYEDKKEADKVNKIAAQVEEVKGVMQQNIQATLKNRENLEVLLDTSDAMKSDASTFSKSSVQAKEHFRWKSMKRNICIVVLLLILLATIITLLVLNKKGSNSISTTV